MTSAIQAVQGVNAFSHIPVLKQINPLSRFALPSPGSLAKAASVAVAATAVSTTSATSMAELVALLGIGASATGSSVPNSAITGAESSVAASVLNPTDVLQGLPSNLSAAALKSLLAIDLGLATTPADATVQSLLTQLAQEMAQTAVPIGGTGTTPTTTSVGSPAATEASAVAAAVATIPVTPAVISPPAATPLAVTAVPESSPSPITAAPAAATSTARTPAAAAATRTAVIANAGMNASNTSTAVNGAASSINQDFLAQAIATISTDPAYAATAASLYANAAIFRAQHASDAALPGNAITIKPVTPVSQVKSMHAAVT